MNAVKELPRFNPDTTAPVMQWPTPRAIKDDLPAAPAFDAQALLPKALADFVMDEAYRMSASPDFVAATLMVALGGVIGAKCALKPKRCDDWIVTPNLWGGIVGEPSAKKTPTANTVMRFLDRLEARENEILADQQKHYQGEMTAFEAMEGAIKNRIKKAANGQSENKQDLMAVLTHELASLDAPKEPKARRFKANDATIEKLADIEAGNEFGLLVFRDELMGLLASWEKEGREGDRAFYLEGWNGTGSYTSDRIGRGSQFVKCHCLSVFGGIQPDLLQRYLSTIINNMDNDGRIQRFQVLVFPEAPSWQWVDRYPVPGAREAVRDIFDRLGSFDPLEAGAIPAGDFVKLPSFAFDDQAQELFIKWATELHTVREPNETNPMIAQTLAKYEKLFCSLALVLHLADGGHGAVNEDTALRAAAWCEYLEGHARRIYALIETAKTSTAKMLAKRLAQGKLANGFTARDVMRKGWTGIKTSADAEAALAILEDHSWLISLDDQPESGRTTTRYTLNPKVRTA